MVWIRGEFGQPRAFCAGVLLLLSVLCAGVSSIRIDGIEPDAGPMSGMFLNSSSGYDERWMLTLLRCDQGDGACVPDRRQG